MVPAVSMPHSIHGLGGRRIFCALSRCLAPVVKCPLPSGYSHLALWAGWFTPALMATRCGVSSAWAQLFDRLSVSLHARYLITSHYLRGFTCHGDQPATSNSNRPAARLVSGSSSGSCSHTPMRSHTKPWYCLWSRFQCTPLICNSPESDRCDQSTTLTTLHSASTRSPPIRRGQQPDSRLMISISLSISWFVQPAL